MKDSCLTETPKKTSMALQNHQRALYELAWVHPQTFEGMSLLIFTQWPGCMRPYFWQPMHQDFSAVGGGHLCLFSIKSGSLISPLSSLSSSRIHFTLYVSINYLRILKWADPTDEQQGTSTVLTDLHLPACHIHNNSAAYSSIIYTNWLSGKYMERLASGQTQHGLPKWGLQQGLCDLMPDSCNRVCMWERIICWWMVGC